MLFNLHLVPEIQFDSNSFARLKFLAQCGNLILFARQIKTRSLGEVAVNVKFFHQRFNLVNRFEAKLITAIRLGRSNLLHELMQGNIHFVLQQAVLALVLPVPISRLSTSTVVTPA